MKEENVISICIAVILLGLFAAASYGCSQVEETKRAAYAAGLQEVQLEGSTTTRIGTPAK